MFYFLSWNFKKAHLLGLSLCLQLTSLEQLSEMPGSTSSKQRVCHFVTGYSFTEGSSPSLYMPLRMSPQQQPSCLIKPTHATPCIFDVSAQAIRVAQPLPYRANGGVLFHGAWQSWVARGRPQLTLWSALLELCTYETDSRSRYGRPSSPTPPLQHTAAPFMAIHLRRQPQHQERQRDTRTSTHSIPR